MENEAANPAFDDLLQGVVNNTTDTIDYNKKSGNPLTEEQLLQLAAALQVNHSVRFISLENVENSDKAVLAMADLLATKTSWHGFFYESTFSETGLQAVAHAIKTNPLITPIIELGGALRSEIIDSAILESGNKNLVAGYTGFDERAEAFCEYNMEIAAEIYSDYLECEGNFSKMFLPCLVEMKDRLRTIGLVAQYMSMGFWGGIEVVDEIAEELGKAFDAFLAAVPYVDVTQALTHEDLVTPNEAGYTVLDNPHTWINFSEIVAQLNKNGTQLQRDILLDENGKPSAFLECAFSLGKASVLFSEANWRGATPQELNRVIKALSPEQKEQVGSLHTLKSTLQSQRPKSEAQHTL